MTTKVERAKEISPAGDAIMKAFEDNETKFMMEQTYGREERLEKTDLQLSSPYEAAYGRSPVVWEGPESYVVYCKLHFPKSLYRKIKYLAQLYDQSFMECVQDLIESEATAQIENTDELGQQIRTRILEQAYDVGKLTQGDRGEAMDKAQLKETKAQK